MKVFYHNDADGKCSAALIWQKNTDLSESDMIEMDYNKNFPLGKISPNETVWIVDFSITPDKMEELLKITKDVVWIDHHKSAIDKYDDSRIDCDKIKGIRSTEAAGCELTEHYLNFANTDISFTRRASRYPEDTTQTAVNLIGDIDTWTFFYGEDSRAFHETFIRAGEPAPWKSWWANVLGLGSYTEHYLTEGHSLLTYSRALRNTAKNAWAYEAEFEGHTILVCNHTTFNSELFGESIKDYPFVAIYCHNGETFKVSLYSTNMDVVEYAIKHGGGGHPRACGFISKDVPFKKTVVSQD